MSGVDVLSGGGEMGALARQVDWRQTAVGPPESWPQSLRTAVSMLLESKFPMLLCWGPDFIQFYNDPFRPILGARKHPALGRSTRDTFAEAWHIIGPLFEQVMAGTAVGFDDMLVPLDRNGFLEECYFVYSYSPFRVESGNVGGVLVTCTETTGRVVAERRLHTLRELASQAAQPQTVDDAWAGAACVLAANAADLPFALLYALEENGGAARLVGPPTAGWSPAVITADAAIPDVAPSDPGSWPLFDPVAAPVEKIVDDVRRRFGDRAGAAWPEPVERALVLPIRRPGLPAPYGFLVAGLSPRLSFDDHYRDFLSLVGDQIATAIANARAYAEERQRTEALLELDRQKTAFFSNVSHEFRTPLTLLLGPIEDALARSPRALTGSELELVHRNAHRLLRLVNTLLDFSRLEARRMQAVFVETDLAALTRETASAFQSLMERAGLTFEIDCPPLAFPVVVDTTMWEKILLNLLSNAFKFTQQGGVSVQLRQRDDSIELIVRDTGAGIPPGDLPHVFDRFHRVEGTPARTFEGSGIGLALVRELVRLHGGIISAQSTVGQGSSFTVTIPASGSRVAQDSRAARTGDHTPSPYIDEASRWSGATAQGVTSGEGAAEGGSSGPVPARILVVDDNADMRDYVRRLLRPHWTVDVAANGREALKHIAGNVPDLVISDVMMPEMDGMELLRQLRASEETRGIPFILLSARSGEESAVEGLSAGADDYVVKPFSARELVARARTQLEVAQLRRETAAQNDRLLTLIDMAPAAIAVVRGPDHVYELANEGYLRLVGRQDVVGKAGRAVLPELVEQGIWTLLDRVYETGQPYLAHELRVELDRLGSGVLDEGFFNFVLQPLKDARGRTEGVLIHAVEVTGLVRGRRSLDDARKIAESANRAKDEFLAMLGHELRNPLAPILTALQLMRLRGEIGAEKERDVIERQVRHVVRLVDDLLDVSRIARGKIELKREHVELATVVAKAIELTSPLIEQKQHALTVDVPAQGLAVHGDPTRLQQILFNLLNNAAKYTEPRGRIAITAARLGDEIEIRVRDSGMGIDPAMLPDIFGLFVQERQALDRSQGGLGLGLAIVRNLAELHGGRAAVSSGGRGLGSEFIITLPASLAAAPAPTAPTRALERSPSAAMMRVLVVDDNEDAASFLAEALRIEGFQTQTAADGPSAIRVAGTFAPHVALLDLGLPVMDGYELAEHLRRSSAAPVLIAVSGYGSKGDQDRSVASGFASHLVKPVDLDELVARLRALQV